jgi:hypothetical protein
MFELYIKYLLEGIAVAVAAYFIPRKKVEISEIIFIALSAAATFAVLDIFAPKVGDGARKGAGFGIGANTVGWPMGGAENFETKTVDSDDSMSSDDSSKEKIEGSEGFGDTNYRNVKLNQATARNSKMTRAEVNASQPPNLEEMMKKMGMKSNGRGGWVPMEHFKRKGSKQDSKKTESFEDSTVASTVASTVSSAVSTVTGSSDSKSADNKSAETKSTVTSSSVAKTDDTSVAEKKSDDSSMMSMDSTGSAVVGYDETKQYSSF